MKRSRVLGLLLVALLIGACGSTAESPVVEQPVVNAAFVEQACQFGAVVFEIGPVALCAKAVALATARLGVVHWPITSVAFRLNMCPPNARCGAAVGDPVQGWVIFTFSTGSPSMVHVGPSEIIGAPLNTLIAGQPQPVPDWLLEQMATVPR